MNCQDGGNVQVQVKRRAAALWTDCKCSFAKATIEHIKVVQVRESMNKTF